MMKKAAKKKRTAKRKNSVLLSAAVLRKRKAAAAKKKRSAEKKRAAAKKSGYRKPVKRAKRTARGRRPNYRVSHAAAERAGQLRLALNGRKKRRTRRNSNGDYAAAASASEGFHGRPVEETYSVDTPVKFHARLAELGELIRLEVRAATGRVVLENFDGARLCMSPDRTQLYIVGGDQSVDLKGFGIERRSAHESEVLGQVRHIVYYTTKYHLGDEGGEANYRHKFGEEGGEMPFLIYDVLNASLSISGGSYTIPDEGIRD